MNAEWKHDDGHVCDESRSNGCCACPPIDPPTDSNYIAAAMRLHHEEGTLEIDDNAVVSRGDDDGAYVQAWVWVYREDAETMGEKED